MQGRREALKMFEVIEGRNSDYETKILAKITPVK